MRALSEIQTHDTSNQAPEGICLRPDDHRDRLTIQWFVTNQTYDSHRPTLSCRQQRFDIN